MRLKVDFEISEGIFDYIREEVISSELFSSSSTKLSIFIILELSILFTTT